MGHRPVRTGHAHRHVLHGYAVCQSRHVVAFHSHRLLAGKRLLRQCMETTETWQRQHGHTGGQQYRDSLPVQPVQHAFPRILAGKGHSPARLLRSCKRHHRLYPAGTPAGGKGQRKHFLRNQETHGAATQNSYSHHRFFVGKDCPD